MTSQNLPVRVEKFKSEKAKKKWKPSKMVVVKFCLTPFKHATCKCQLEFLTRTKLFSSRRHVLPFVTTVLRQKEWFIFSNSSGQIETYIVRKPSHPCGRYEINYSNRKIKMNFGKNSFWYKNCHVNAQLPHRQRKLSHLHSKALSRGISLPVIIPVTLGIGPLIADNVAVSLITAHACVRI